MKKIESDVQIELHRLNENPIANYPEWAATVMRVLQVAPKGQQATCRRLIVRIAPYTSTHYFAIARLIAQFMDDRATVTRIERGTFELITYTDELADYSAVLIYLLTAVNELTISYCSTQVRIWRDECRALRIPYKDRKTFGKHGRTEAIRDSFFAQALEELYFKMADYFKNNKNNF